MVYIRKGLEEEIEVVMKEDNHIILQEKNKKKIEGVYMNGRWALGKIEKMVGKTRKGNKQREKHSRRLEHTLTRLGRN